MKTERQPTGTAIFISPRASWFPSVSHNVSSRFGRETKIDKHYIYIYMFGVAGGGSQKQSCMHICIYVYMCGLTHVHTWRRCQSKNGHVWYLRLRGANRIDIYIALHLHVRIRPLAENMFLEVRFSEPRLRLSFESRRSSKSCSFRDCTSACRLLLQESGTFISSADETLGPPDLRG